MRAITVPIAGPVVDGGQESQNEAWKRLRESIKIAFRGATRASNWMVRELAKAEEPRSADQKKLGKMPQVYLYPGARALVPELATSTVVALCNSVEQRYRARRFQAIWLCAESLPNYRYPAPVPFRPSSWRMIELPGGAIGVNVTMGTQSTDTLERWVLRLRGGAGFRRQWAALRMLLDGRAEACELVLMEKSAQKNDRRSGGNGRSSGGGQKRYSNLMAKIVMWMPRQERKKRSGVVSVRTQTDAFWSYRVGDEEERYLYADHIKNWIGEYRRRLDRSEHDLKHEKRWPRKVREQAIAARDAWMQKHHHRLDTFIHQATSMLTGYAARLGVAQVIYDDGEHGFVESFPWHMLKEKLKYKLDEHGIEFIASGAVVSDDAMSLADK